MQYPRAEVKTYNPFVPGMPVRPSRVGIIPVLSRTPGVQADLKHPSLPQIRNNYDDIQ